MERGNDGNFNLLCCAGADNENNFKTEVVPMDDGLNHIRTNVIAVKAIIKLQALIRGRLIRLKMSRYQMSVHMSDKHFGHSVTGNFTNKAVLKVIQKLGPYQFDSDKAQQFLGTAGQNLEFRADTKISDVVKYDG